MNYKESITALLEGLKGIFENKTATEASAIAQAATKPSTIFYTSDTHAIVVGGHVYGRSNQVSADAPFAYLPADVSSPSADPQFDGNHDTIYIQPIKTGADAGKIKLWWYVNNAWISSDTLDLVLPTDAEDITYDLTNTPDLGSGDVQSAIEALDGKVEDLRDEVLGDEWVDEIFGRKADWIRTGCFLNKEGKSFSASSVTVCFGIKVNGGETFHGISRNHSGESIIYVYDYYIDRSGSGNYAGALSTPIAKTSQTSYDGRPIDEYITLPQNARMVVVTLQVGWAEHPYDHVYSDRGTPISIADKTGYKINTWTDDEIITSTTLAVGSVVPYWSDGTRYGCRGVRLNVKEGDKVLLDTYSPALYGLIFTDENRVVKAIYDDRRFDGVWTAPCNGYCYIQDVLYRENYHYASAHGHLAYMAHDARKRVAKGGDWYNEYAMRRITQILPLELSFKKTGSATNGWVTQFVVDGTQNLTAFTNGRFVLVLFKYYVYEDSSSVGSMATNTSSGIGTAVITVDGHYTPGTYQYTYRIYRSNTDSVGGYIGAYWYGIPTEPNTHVRLENVFLHSSSDFAELYALAQKIVNGEVEVDNFYGVKENEVDFVKNAIGLQSISDLGYNILEHGATLPIDEEGYKYAKVIYDRYKDNPPTGNNWQGTTSPFNHNPNLVYLPQIDFSKFKTSGTDYLGAAFHSCINLVCVGDITLPEESTGGYANFFNSTFLACFSLKQVGNIQAPMNKNSGCYRMFYNCFALEKVGKIIVKGHSSSSLFVNCYSLERIEEIVLRDLPYDTNGNTSLLYNCVNLRYMLGKELGTRPASGTYMFNYSTLWGIPNDKQPDARQSLVDSLLTYSYDRVNDPDNLGTAGTTCTITLSANTYAQLTASEIEAITAKGYTLTHP